MKHPVGVLVDRRTLRGALRGKTTTERVGLYRAIARDDLGIDIVVFAIEDVSLASHRVTAYAPAASGWRKVRVPVPQVIHKRVLYRTGTPLAKVRKLHRRGVIFVNPPLIQNKAGMNEALAQAPAVRPHLPPTFAYRWERLAEMLDAGTRVILKPRVGSVGQGIMRLIPEGRWTQLTTRTTRTLSRSALRARLRKAIGTRRYLLQEYINLAKYEGRPFDLRVPVQRDGSGRWTLPGVVAKVARKHPFLTNAGQGGRVLPGVTALAHAFGESHAREVMGRIGEVALAVAKAVARNHPYAADLGLDMGVDVNGKPWVIEVNTRDQRYTFHEAGLEAEFRILYRNPLAFCSHLAEVVESGGSWTPQD